MVWNCAKEAGNSAGFGTAEVSPGRDEVYDTENVLGPAVLSASVITGDRNVLWECIPDKMLNFCAEVLWGFSWSIVPVSLGT